MYRMKLTAEQKRILTRRLKSASLLDLQRFSIACDRTICAIPKAIPSPIRTDEYFLEKLSKDTMHTFLWIQAEVHKLFLVRAKNE